MPLWDSIIVRVRLIQSSKTSRPKCLFSLRQGKAHYIRDLDHSCGCVLDCNGLGCSQRAEAKAVLRLNREVPVLPLRCSSRGYCELIVVCCLQCPVLVPPYLSSALWIPVCVRIAVGSNKIILCRWASGGYVQVVRSWRMIASW